MIEGRNARSAVIRTVLLLLVTASAASLLISCGVNAGSVYQGGAASSSPPNPDKTTPRIDWPQPAPINNPTPLSATQLDATANVAGTFVYSPAAGTVLTAGTQKLSTTFTPEDAADYNTATTSVVLIVKPAISSSAHIYVDSLPDISGGNPGIPPATYGYAVADDGSLTTIPGFPLSYAFAGVVSGNYLFANDSDGVHLDTYRINADGTFTKIESTVDQPATQCKCEFGPAMTDRFGSNLYVLLYHLGHNFFYQTFGIDQTTGGLTYRSVSDVTSGPGWGFAIEAVSGNNRYIYGDFCAYGPCEIRYFSRNTDGSILGSAIGGAVKGLTPPPGVMYSMYDLHADSANHLVAVLASYDDDKMMPLDVPNRLVTFTINSDGTLTTTNTAADMTVPAVQPMSAISLSPSGKLLAVAGNNGLQIFNFNGAAPPTPETGVIPTDSITQLLWDNHHHLYGLSYSQKMYVFDITPGGAVQASGSPHSIPNALSMFIQP